MPSNEGLGIGKGGVAPLSRVPSGPRLAPVGRVQAPIGERSSPAQREETAKFGVDVRHAQIRDVSSLLGAL